ncbi:MAG: AmmeMemoRadiSam system protein B [Nitrospirae bacterium GWC2_42_7]|nr:MAG: AmmeMemoRadiSam system protein B [Nitrospirae bacterium GWC2_42_7]
MKRTAAVAGHFYQNSSSLLSKQVDEYIVHGSAKEDVMGIVAPHAGLVYSGSVAGAVYSSINFPGTFLLLGPNHTGIGPKISMMEEGEWEIPTGIFEIDRKLANRISRNTETVTKDSQAHIFEHSLEVQLPFMAFLGKSVKILPITILSASLEDCASLGEGISKAIKGIGYPVVIVASSDMSHYLPDKTARKKDSMAINKVLDLDPEGLYETVLKENISMCGYLPVVVMLFAVKSLGAVNARLVKYMTSGDISGDYDSVVGYAGITLK